MGERRALVIGARNDRFGRLDFVEQVATDLHRALMDTSLGRCAAALSDGRDLLLGEAASCNAIKGALADAIQAAANDQATLFIYFLGHGRLEGEDFYLIASDTPGGQVDSETAVAIGQRIKELLRQYATIDGLMLVLDACHSGAAILDPVPGLLRSGVRTRMEILAATREDQTASNACFTRSLITLLTRGSASTADEYLRAYDEHSRLRDIAPVECKTMPSPVHVSLSGGTDAGLWLGRNHAADVRPALIGSRAAAEVARLTRELVQTVHLSRLLGMILSGASPIAIVGGAGTGKSTLLASLGRVSIAGLGGIDALVTIRPGDTLATIAERLVQQLNASVSYQQASDRWIQRVPEAERGTRSAFDQAISGPVANLTAADRVRIGVDGVEHLGTLDRRRLLEAFTGKPGAVLVITARSLAELDNILTLPERDTAGVAELLASLVSDAGIREGIGESSAGDWLLARILAGLWQTGMLESAGLGSSLSVAFDSAISAANVIAPTAPVERVLAALAAVPAGAGIPLELLAKAVVDDGDAAGGALVARDAVVALGELVARVDPGTADEWIGPAHDLVAEYLVGRLTPAQFAEIHLRLAQVAGDALPGVSSLGALAYSRRHRSDHFWLAGRIDLALAAVARLETPADNLGLWHMWQDRLADLPHDHPLVLDVRNIVATLTGQAGDAHSAVSLFEDLLPEVIRVQGENHADTFKVRGNLALWTGRAGQPEAALREFEALLDDQTRVLGPDDPDVMKTRVNIVTWTGESGNAQGALDLANILLPDQVRVAGADDPITLAVRFSVVSWTAKSGHPQDALRLAAELLPVEVGILGPDHTDTLATRAMICILTAQLNGPRAALGFANELLPDQVRVLGNSHPDVLKTQSNIANWTGATGNFEAALIMAQDVLLERERVLGRDHPDTLGSRNNVAIWTARSGRISEALAIWDGLLSDQQRLLGADHPDTFDTRGNKAIWTAQVTSSQDGLEQLRALLADEERVLGRDHPHTAITRNNITDLISKTRNG